MAALAFLVVIFVQGSLDQSLLPSSVIRDRWSMGSQRLQEPRKTEIMLIYEGIDISRDIAPFLLSFEYTDKSSGESDDLQIQMEDCDGKWRDPWFPNKNDRIEATIVTRNWMRPNDSKSLYCGSFKIDEVEISEPPMTVSVKAVSVPRTSSLRNEVKTRAWEDYTLSRIAQDIADGGGLALEFLSAFNPKYDRTDQVQTPDLQYLLGLCVDAGLALKVSDGRMVIYDEKEYEGNPAVTTIRRGDKRIIGVNFKTKMAGTFHKTKVAYHDTLLDETHEAESTDEESPDNGQIQNINQRVRSQKEAQDLADKKHFQANKKEVTGSLALAGDLGIVAAVNVTVSGWGKFDGNYFVESAKHSYGSGGYITTIDVREGSPSKKKKKSKQIAGVSTTHESLL